ncbi:twin-arginine translocation signal domain-containing protein [Chromobacterium vaccinii]|uniref:carbonic anhydrase n=1 Tax=Chromobacterium vaccinii TaxID=1108595 RepID=UPI001E3781CC|nr:carbonic anhydrase [Chromobacterium vaccinii]MCD4486423.1 twin-arginine translocation signal domain-containing protein [Chromobacterium vaccinii]
MCETSRHERADCLASLEERPLGRRGFLKLASLGGGAVLLGSFLPRTSWAAGGTDALLLSCMDYRLVHAVGEFMDGLDLRGKYDHIVLAGASMVSITDKFPDWNATFWQHLGVAIDLHHIKRVVLLDHRDCGAYKVAFGEDFAQDPGKETRIHAKALLKLRDEILDKHPALAVETYLMALDGKVEVIAA